MGRRARGGGEGSVYRRRSDGMWVATWYDPTGKRRYAYGADADAAVDARKAKRAGYDERQTLGEYLSWWTQTWLPRRVRAGKLGHRTAADYRAQVARYIHGQPLADVRLANLRFQHVDDWLAALEQRPIRGGGTLAPRTIQYAHATLRTALATARRNGLIPANPAELVEPPTVRRSPQGVLQPEQVPEFLAACAGDRLEALWKVVLPIGLRIGEALAIPVDAVDLEAGTVYIGHSLSRVDDVTGDGKVWLWKDTKNHAEATLALPTWALDALRRRLEVRDLERMIAGDVWADLQAVDETGRPVSVALLFCRADGQPMWHSTVSTALARLCMQAGLPRMTPHALRHSCASLLAAQGADLVDIQKLLRHASGRLTADLYTHLVDSVQRDHVARMDHLAEEEDR